MLQRRPLAEAKEWTSADLRRLLRNVWVLAALALLCVGLALQEAVPAAVGALVLLTGIIAILWSRLALERVTYQRQWSCQRAFVGEEIEARFTLRNRKALPMPWFEVREVLPQALPTVGARTLNPAWEGAYYLSHSTSLAFYERVSWRQRFTCAARGYYEVGPARLRSGDLFGLFPRESIYAGKDFISILPRRLDLGDVALPFLRPFGATKGGSRIFEDQSRMAGVRDYRPGDPLKRIDWKATARRGALQSRLYDPSATATLVIALNADTFAHSWEGYDPLLLERAVAVAGSIAAIAEERGLAFGVITNCSHPGADRPIIVPSNRDPGQLSRVLEALAMVGSFTITTPEELLDQQARRLPLGASVALVAAYMTPALALQAARMARDGTALALYWVGDEPPEHRPPGIAIHDLTARLRAFERADALAYGGDTAAIAARPFR